MRRVDEDDEILMVSHAGLAVRFRECDARAMGRDTSGVRGMDVADKGNYVLAMDVARPGQDLLVVTEGGYGKRTSVDEYRLTSRGAKGVKTITFTEAKGLLSGALVVREHEELVFISQNGMVQRTVGARDQPLRPHVAGREGDEPARGRSASRRSRWWSRARARPRPSVPDAELPLEIADGGPAATPTMSARTPRRRTRTTSSGGRSASRFATLRITRERGWSEVE